MVSSVVTRSPVPGLILPRTFLLSAYSILQLVRFGDGAHNTRPCRFLYCLHTRMVCFRRLLEMRCT